MTTAELIAPSEALNQEFILPEGELLEAVAEVKEEALVLSTHAFELGNFRMLLPSDQVTEVIERADMRRLPNTPPWFKGMMNLRGNIIPVFELEKLMNFESPRRKNPLVLVVGTGEKSVGILSTELPFRVTLSPDDRMSRVPPLPEALQPFARACYKTDQIWVNWDLTGFFKAVGARMQ